MPKPPDYKAETHKRGQTLCQANRGPQIGRGQGMAPGVAWNRKAFEGSQLWKSLMLVFYVGSCLVVGKLAARAMLHA